ncbi:glycosyltransferase [Microcoleus sp. FACHB-1515]|uniref:2'-O-glycosyltransferase CruG n=1 Tax=Cyanophyceae TaxID=3028117 RepID=UPI0016840898|nr:glycosyltransferase [Microcoleus sp. FACHB-1515]MBD2092459.1 glycosyltransferase [Microcoleus sp. FACHB-1515]
MESSSVENLFVSVIAIVLLVIQIPTVAILLSRLLKGPGRYPPLTPKVAPPELLGTVSIVVPTLNEAERISPCLAGLTRQGHEVREVVVVDSRSQDGTVDLVKAAAQRDPRFRVMTDDPLPPGWVGRPWALHNGFLHSSDRSTWVLGIDADTQPQPGLVASVVATAEAEGYDLLSLAPQFILKYPGELCLQPALLMTLLYRFGPAGASVGGADRIMANGQCFLSRRSLLSELGGYSSARDSFCDDVTLARNAAHHGAKVGFFDGSQILKVRMYEGAAETWREWGRSLDLKDACTVSQKWGDVAFLFAVQGIPLLAFVGLAIAWLTGIQTLPVLAALVVNVILLIIRFGMLLAIQSSYDRSQSPLPWIFWLSPLADPLAVVRILISSIQTPKQWRGRSYSSVK